MSILHGGAMAPSTRPQVGWQRLLVAVLQSALLVWLHRAAASASWPATVPVLLVPLVLVLVLSPVVLIVSLGRLAPRRIALWFTATTLLVAAVGYYDAWSTILQPGERVSPSVLPSLALVVGLYIAQAVMNAACARAGFLVTEWKLAVQLVLSLVFVVALWLGLILGSLMFRLIELNVVVRLMDQDWFNIPLFACAFACAIHATDVRAGSGRPSVILLACLLPVATLLVIGFFLSLPFTGLPPPMATGFAAAVLMAAAGLLVVLLHAARYSGLAWAARWNTRVASLMVLPLVLCAAVSLMLRVHAVGWSGARAVAAAGIVVACCYAARALAGAPRSGAPAAGALN